MLWWCVVGKASRRKREGRQTCVPTPAVNAKPRWAGADGFDYAWNLNRLYIDGAETLLSATDELGMARGAVAMAGLEANVLSRQVTTLEAAAEYKGIDLGPKKPRAERPARMQPWFPGFKEIDASVERHRPYARALGALAYEHEMALLQSTPILFDPLSMPELDRTAFRDLQLPFPVITCDFLTATGMSMPVVKRSDAEGEWVGLVAATMRQSGSVIDVWPVIATLHERESDDQQDSRSLLFGRARFGGKLPEPPESITPYESEGVSVWTVGVDNDVDLWANLWVVLPAYAAATALGLLEAVNVDLEPAQLSRPARRRAARDGAKPALEVVVRTSHAAARQNVVPSSIDWQHRWTVRGHWKHFTKGPIFNSNPRRHTYDPEGNPCVKVWCPPFVKGPEGKPLVLKSRRVV